MKSGEMEIGAMYSPMTELHRLETYSVVRCGSNEPQLHLFAH